ncbi:unnamed protein product, partial [Ectocarpus sp. 12 AP-2014]
RRGRTSTRLRKSGAQPSRRTRARPTAVRFAGANGDRQKKVVGAGQSSGNRCGSKVPFASRLQEVPGVALLCDGCGHDWCGLPRGRGVARGYVDKDNAVVTVVQEKHWKCKKRCKPAAGAKVRIDGVEYTVKSAQDGQFRRGSV